MDQDQKQLLNEVVELTRENNKILRSINRGMRISRIMSIIYWIFIIGSAVGAYYLIQPYIDALTGSYSGAKSSVNNMGSSFGGILDTLNSLNQ